MHGDTANVDFLGVLNAGKEGTISYSDVIVKRIGSDWRVADYKLDGRPVSKRFRPLSGSVASDGVTLRVVGSI